MSHSGFLSALVTVLILLVAALVLVAVLAGILVVLILRTVLVGVLVVLILVIHGEYPP